MSDSPELPPFPGATPLADDGDVLAQLAFFNLTEADEWNLALVREVLRQHAPAIVARFYEHLLGFDECRKILVPALLVERLQRTQQAYLGTLGDFRVTDAASVVAYFEYRRRVGVAHERVGLAPRLYTGAYAQLGTLSTAAVALAYPGRTDLLISLHKILVLDSHLALEAYQRTREHTLNERARLDALTGVETRAAALEALGRELARAARFHRPMALLFIDVDRFKQVNDTLGHAAGDALLRVVGRTLAESVRPVDVVGRYGGDEFVVGLIETGLEAAMTVAERMRSTVTSRGGCTLSIGVATRCDDDTLEDLLTRADRAMYESKAAGRNAVSSAPRASRPA